VLVVFWMDNGPVTIMTTIHGMVGEEWEIMRERRRPRDTSAIAVKVRAVFGNSPRKEFEILKVVDDYNSTWVELTLPINFDHTTARSRLYGGTGCLSSSGSWILRLSTHILLLEKEGLFSLTESFGALSSGA